MEVLPTLASSVHDIHGYEYDEDEYYNGIISELDHHLQHPLSSSSPSTTLQNIANIVTDATIPSTTTTTTTLSSEILLQCRQQPQHKTMGMDYDEPTSTTNKLFEIFCDNNNFINNFIFDKSTNTTKVHAANIDQNINESHITSNISDSSNNSNYYKSNDYLFDGIIKNISRYKCDLINTQYNYDNDINVANYQCSHSILTSDDQINVNGNECTFDQSVYSTKIIIENVINPITEFILNLPRAIYDLAGGLHEFFSP